MFDFRISILLGMLFLTAILYMIEVHMGTFSGMHDHEAGLLPSGCIPQKSPITHFFGGLVPLQLAAVGVPILANDPVLGGVLLFVSLVLFGMPHIIHGKEEEK